MWKIEKYPLQNVKGQEMTKTLILIIITSAFIVVSDVNRPCKTKMMYVPKPNGGFLFLPRQECKNRG